MIHEIIDHPGIEREFDNDVIDKLARIDLTKDAVICFNPVRKDGDVSRVVSYDIDQFVIKTHEQYKALPQNSILTFKTFPRVKISLPNGLFPDFSSLIKGLHIRNVSFDKLQGIELNQSLDTSDIKVDFTAEKGRYSFYHNIEINYGVFDHTLFKQNKFTGNYLPPNTPLCNLRLLPHFIGTELNLNNIYVICSKYIHSRLPNF